MACSLFVKGFQNTGEHYHCSLFVDSICVMCLFLGFVMCLFLGCLMCLFLVSVMSMFSLFCEVFSLCSVRFLVCVL